MAYELAALRSVLLLEAEPVLGWHSTSRSAATWIPGFGTDIVRALVAASGPRFSSLADELGAPPLLVTRTALWVAVDSTGERSLAALLADSTNVPDGPVAVEAREAESRCPALAPGCIRAAGLSTRAADIDTEGLSQGYIRGLRARGGRVRTTAPVTALRRDGAGWRVEVPGATLTADVVVDAAGAWVDELATMAGVPPVGLVTVRRTIAIARVSDPSRLRAQDGGSPIVVEAGGRFYFKAEGNDLLVSPADETPVEPGDVRPDELDVATALERVEAVTALGLRSVRASWAGLRSFASDRRPVVGEWQAHPGFWFVAGQGGFGIETAPALAALAAAVITGGTQPADVSVDPACLSPSRLALSST